MAARTTQRETRREPSGGVARAAAQEVKDQVADRIAAEKSSVVRQVMGLAEVLRATAEQLDGREYAAFAGYAERAADVAERVGDAIERKTLSEIISDVERASRERPVVAGAVAAAVGFIAARLARSSVDSDGEGSEPRSRAARRGVRSQARAHEGE